MFVYSQHTQISRTLICRINKVVVKFAVYVERQMALRRAGYNGAFTNLDVVVFTKASLDKLRYHFQLFLHSFFLCTKTQLEHCNVILMYIGSVVLSRRGRAAQDTILEDVSKSKSRRVHFGLVSGVQSFSHCIASYIFNVCVKM